MSLSLKKWQHYLVCICVLTACGFALVKATGQHADASHSPEETVIPFSLYCCDAHGSLLSVEDGNSYLLTGGIPVSITYQGLSYSAYSFCESPISLLRRLNISVSPLEMVSLTLADGKYQLEIASELVFYETVTTVFPHETIVNTRTDKPDWYEATLTPGVDGSTTSVYEMIYQDGTMVSRQLVEESSVAAVAAITEVGTVPNFANFTDVPVDIQTSDDGSGTMTLENGQEITFSKVMSMTGTAYTANVGKVGTITASGSTVREGIVAVDRRVLPLGTKVYVVDAYGNSYGFCIAEDTGVTGKSIDLYMNTLEAALKFGRRTCTVYILD